MRTLWFLAIVLPSFAQSASPRVGIAYLEGKVTVDGQSSWRLDNVLPENSLVRAGKGRAEIRFGRGDTMFLGASSSIRLRGNAGPEILTGSAVVFTGGLGPVVACVQAVQLSDGGLFRFDAHEITGDRFCQLKVYKGAAATQMPSFIWLLTAGKTINLNPSCGDHTQRNVFNVQEIDELDRWSRERAGLRATKAP